MLPECKAIGIQEQNITASQLSLPVLWSFLLGPPRLHGPKGKGVIQAISCVSANCPQNASHLLLCNVIFRCFYFFMNQGFSIYFLLVYTVWRTLVAVVRHVLCYIKTLRITWITQCLVTLCQASFFGTRPLSQTVLASPECSVVSLEAVM